MNAIKFIKEHGVDKAREVVEGAPDGATHLSDDACHYVNADFKPLPAHIKEQLPELIVINDLKRLVESVDLIDSLGGLELSKKESNDCRFYEYADMSHRSYAIRQAIADCESIKSCKCVSTRTYENGTCNKCGMQDMGDDSHIENHISPNCKVGVK